MNGDPIERLALDFFARGRSGDISGEEAAAIESWLARDPRHRAAYERNARLWTELEELRLDSAILQMREDALGAIAARRRRTWAAGALAASLLGGLLFAGTTFFPSRSPHSAEEAVRAQMFATQIGRIARVTLPDGSTAVLDTDSAIRSRIGDGGARQIEVLRGRVQFAVAKMPERPFSVSVNGTTVTALGTRFDVYRRGGGIEVNLAEGRLRVAQPLGERDGAGQGRNAVEMTAGDRLVVENRNWRLARGIAPAESDWVKGQLVFDNAPIGSVIAELNRYTTNKLVLTDRTIAARPISAVIRSDNPAMFLGAIRALDIDEVKVLVEK